MTIKNKMTKGLAALVLAGTLFTSTACYTTRYNFYFIPQAVAQVESVSSKNLAVLLIDMQDYFLKEVSEEEKKSEIPYQLEVLNYCKDNNIPVFVLEYLQCGETTRILKEKVDSLPVKEYVTKGYNDSFLKTDLEAKLKSYGIESMLLMGVNASGCVKDTAEGAIRAGFKIMTSKDLIADPDWHVTEEFIIKKDGTHGKSDNSAPWYKKHGIYRDNYKELLRLIKKEQN
ncbi:MAG: isochorismatase family protein [Nanoarchaeota archaeon]|nr:isochorismatase family protein [Nanoarchaeota archaeon]